MKIKQTTVTTAVWTDRCWVDWRGGTGGHEATCTVPVTWEERTDHPQPDEQLAELLSFMPFLAVPSKPSSREAET